jgi:hypothetical protein
MASIQPLVGLFLFGDSMQKVTPAVGKKEKKKMGPAVQDWISSKKGGKDGENC